MMLFDVMHPEDVKAAIRKRYRSVAAFERAEGLARQSVAEILRGRASSRTLKAIERVLREDGQKRDSIIPVDSRNDAGPHRINAEVR